MFSCFLSSLLWHCLLCWMMLLYLLLQLVLSCPFPVFQTVLLILVDDIPLSLFFPTVPLSCSRVKSSQFWHTIVFSHFFLSTMRRFHLYLCQGSLLSALSFGGWVEFNAVAISVFKGTSSVTVVPMHCKPWFASSCCTSHVI